MFSERPQVHRLPAQVTVFLHISETFLRARHNYYIFFFVLLRVASLLVVLLRSSSYLFGLFALLLSFSFVFAFLCSPAHPLTRSVAHSLTRSLAHPVTRSVVHSLSRLLSHSVTSVLFRAPSYYNCLQLVFNIVLRHFIKAHFPFAC